MKNDFKNNKDLYSRQNAIGYDANVNPKSHLAMIIILITVLAIVIVSAIVSSRHKQPNTDFQIKNTEHFAILYTEKDKEYIEDFTTQMEKDYKKLTEDLRIFKSLKITIKLYPDKASFRESLNGYSLPDYMPALSVSPTEVRMISLNTGDIGCTPEVAKTYAFSQLTYCIVASTAQKMPKGWMLSAFIAYEAGGINEADKLAIMKTRNYNSLREIENIPYGEASYGAYTVGEYIVDKWGSEALAELINTGGDIKLALGKSEAEFEKGWIEYIHEKYK